MQSRSAWTNAIGVLAVWLLVPAGALAQREVHVSDTAELRAALADAMPGDTILVGPGRYTDPEALWYFGFNPARSGTEAQPIVIRADPPLGATLVGETNVARCGTAEDPGDCVALGIYQREHVVVDGFRVEGMLKIQSSSYVTLENCDVLYGSREGNDISLLWGIALHVGEGGSRFNTVRNNRVHELRGGNRSHNTAGIMLFGETSDNVIEGNEVDAGPCTDGGDPACAVYSAYGQKGGNVHDNTWRCNVALNAVDAFHGMGSTNEEDYSDDNVFFGNIIVDSVNAFGCNHNCRRWQIYNNTAYGVRYFFKEGRHLGNSDTELWNNIVVGATSVYHAEEPADVGGLIAIIADTDDNLFYDVGAIASWQYGGETLDTLESWRSASGFDERSSIADPRFVDPSARDFRFMEGSPAIDGGRDGADLGANMEVCSSTPAPRPDGGMPDEDAGTSEGDSGTTIRRDGGASTADGGTAGSTDGCACRAGRRASPIGALFLSCFTALAMARRSFR
jgi:hypothetical protein